MHSPWTASCPQPTHPLPTPFPQLHELAGYPHAHNHGEDGEISFIVFIKKNKVLSILNRECGITFSAKKLGNKILLAKAVFYQIGK
jgi:hypothetical protein